LNAVRDGDQDRAQADGERCVAPPVDASGMARAGVAKFQIRPDGSEKTDGHVHPEHRAPVDRGQQPSGDQPDELSR
jgi:hypothetical protein